MLPGIGIPELVLIGVIAIVLFGRRLPEVAKNLGKSYGELRKGVHELQSSIRDETDINSSTTSSSDTPASSIDDYDEPTAPRLQSPPVDDHDEPTAPRLQSSPVDD